MKEDFLCQDYQRKQKLSGHFLLTLSQENDSLISYVNIVSANVSKAIVLRFLLAPTIKSVSKRVPQTPHNLQTMGRWGNTLLAF